jgi:hypothetical protein
MNEYRNPLHHALAIDRKGIILAYYFKKYWWKKAVFSRLADRPRTSGLGYEDMVNYKQAPVGPYRELLFMRFFCAYRPASITKIYVDSKTAPKTDDSIGAFPKKPFRFGGTHPAKSTALPLVFG